MKLSENVMTLLITLLGILPFAWFVYIGKKASLKNKKAIKDLLKREHMKFNESEFWNHNFIGIDETTKTLMFVKLNAIENKVLKMDLNDVKSCQILKDTKEHKRDKKMESELQTLNLELLFDSKKPNIILSFYDIADNLSEDFEMKRAEKWKALIQQAATKNFNKKAA